MLAGRVHQRRPVTPEPQLEMLIRATACTNAIEAHLIRLRLEAEDIPAWVVHDQHIGADWTKSLALGGVKVCVRECDLDRARLIIAAHERGDFALDDDPPGCPRCHARPVLHRRRSWKAALLTAHLACVPLAFRWATAHCPQCRHEWDLPDTRAYPLLAVAMTVTVATVILLAFVFAAFCFENPPPSGIFPPMRGCR